MEKGRHAERTKARLKRLTNPTEQSARKWRVSLPTQMSGDKSMLTRVSNSPAQFSEATQPAWLEETREMRATNHLLQGQAITEPSVLNQIYQTASTIQLKELTIGRKIECRSPSRNYYCQERQEILEISRWISGKMDNLRQQPQFDLSIFVDYRQFVVNLALDRLLSIFRRYSVEAADLMTELWRKTFGFMEVLLTVFSKQHTQKQLAIAKLEREREQLHVHYLARLKQEQKQLIQNIQHLNGELKSTVQAGRQLKKKCSQLTRTIGDQKKQIKQLEEALIRSLHINMQCASGEHLQWSYRVFNTLARSYGKVPNPIPSGKQDPARTQALVLAAYRNVGSAYESSQRRDLEDRFEDDEEGRWQEQLSVTRILEMAAPRDVGCSTADLYDIQDVGIQCVPQQQHQSSNTPHNPKCQVGLQVRLPMKQYGVQTRQAGRDSSANLLKNRFNAGGFSRTSQASHGFAQSVSMSRQPSMSNYSELLSTEPQQKGSPFHNSHLTNSISKIRLNNRTANMTIIHPEVDQANSYGSSEEEETGTDQRNLELNLDLNFGEVYINNKRSLLQNEAGFKRRITKQRSFYQSPRLYKPVHLSIGVPYVDSSIRKHHKHEVWIQDILPKERIWQQVLRDARHKLISPASVQMATGSLFRMFSQIIQTLCRAEKFGSIKQQTKSLRAQRPRRLQALRYIVMRRLNDIIRTQFQRELRQLTNNLLFLRRTKELEMFSMLMGLSEGYAEVGANQLELYVRTFALLDSSQKFQVEKDARTTSFLLCDKLQQITEGYFEQDERERLLQKLLKTDCSHLMIDDIARTLVKKYTEKKRLSYDSYEYLFECSRHFGFAQLKCLIRHFNISHRTKSIMLREFGRLIDCSNSKGRYISYERFWTFCERVNFPSRSVLIEFFRKESIQQQVVEYCSELPEKTVDLLADHHLRIPPLLTEILKFLRRNPQPTKVEFWTLFLLAFSSQEILQQKASRLFPEQFQLLLEAGYPRQ